MRKSISLELGWRDQSDWSGFTGKNAANTEHRYGLWLGRLLILVTTYNEKHRVKHRMPMAPK